MTGTIFHGMARAACALVLFTGTLAAVTMYTARPAQADNCSSEQAIFVQDVGNSGVRGTEGNIYIRDHVLDGNCSENPGAWSMVNFFSSDFSAQGETGYREYAGHYFDDVTCWSQGNMQSCYLNHSVTVSPGYTYEFKVVNYPLGTTDLNSWIYTSSGWIETASTTGAPFTQGYSTGETGRYGDGTGMLDHHSYLQYKDSSNNWHFWSAQGLYSDNVDGGAYYWHQMTNSQYEICQNGGSCPWQ